MTAYKNQTGMSLVEVIIASAILLLFFGGLITGVKLMIDLIGQSKAETGARSLALSRIEYLRSLNYEDLGTVGGIPAGNISQTATTSLNGIDYTERVLILYTDRAEDGLEEEDENGVLEDSKIVKVEYSWLWQGESKSVALVTDVAPKGQETSNGGGTLIVKVFDSLVQPLAGAVVRIINDTLDPAIDLTVSSNSSGKAIFPGTPAGGNYKIIVTKEDYSVDQTYDITEENTNPNPPHVAVASSTITTMTFFVDELSELTFRTIGEPIIYEFSDDFSNVEQLAYSESVVANEGLMLATGEFGGYESSGYAYSNTLVPTTINAWQEIDWSVSVTEDTNAFVHLYSEEGDSLSLVPDVDLPGNSTGFTLGPIDISGLSTTTYSRLILGVNLETANSSSTPILEKWELSYIENEPPLDDISFSITGTKQIGSDVLKYSDDITTDSDGLKTVTLEWDTYHIALTNPVSAYNIKEVRGALPYILPAGITETLTFVLVPYNPRTLHVTITDGANNPINDASVQLSASGFDATLSTSIYGQVFFDNLNAGEYSLSVSKDGYVDYLGTLNVSGNENNRIDLVQL